MEKRTSSPCGYAPSTPELHRGICLCYPWLGICVVLLGTTKKVVQVVRGSNSQAQAATSTRRHLVPEPRLVARLQMLPAVPFLSKVLATKMPLAWEELEQVRKKKSPVPVIYQAVGARTCLSGTETWPKPSGLPDALSCLGQGVKPGVGGPQHLCSGLGNAPVQTSAWPQDSQQSWYCQARPWFRERYDPRKGQFQKE